MGGRGEIGGHRGAGYRVFGLLRSYLFTAQAVALMIVLRYHCDKCGQFVNKNEVMKRGELHYCHDCYKDVFSAPAFTQILLKVF